MGKFPKYFLKTNMVYGLLAIAFSLIGILLPSVIPLNSPISSATIEHIVGHIIWGMMVGILSFSLRGAILAGSFAVILDADHLIQFLEIEAIPRMAHSVPFAILSFAALPLIFGKKKLLIGAIGAAAVFSHISFDTIIGTGDFPLFVPFYNNTIIFANWYGMLFQLLAACIILFTWFIQTKYYKIDKFC